MSLWGPWYRALVVTCLVSAGSSMYGQLSGSGCLLRGEIAGAPTLLMSGTVVELVDVSGRSPVAQTNTTGSGEFSFPNVPDGNHLVRLVSTQGDVMTEQLVTVQRCMDTVRLRIKPQPVNTPGSSPVSLARLQHKIPAKAASLLKKAERARKSGDLPKSIAALHAALQLDPEYVEALNNLGHHYMLMGRPEEALALFDRAAQLDPGAGLVHANRGLALLTLRRPATRNVPRGRHCHWTPI